MKTVKARGTRKGKPHPSTAARSHRRTILPPIWQEVLKIARSIPKPDLLKLPTDLSVNHDHYLYGGRRQAHLHLSAS